MICCSKAIYSRASLLSKHDSYSSLRTKILEANVILYTCEFYYELPSDISATQCTVCLRCSDPFYKVTYYVYKMGHYFLDLQYEQAEQFIWISLVLVTSIYFFVIRLLMIRGVR